MSRNDLLDIFYSILDTSNSHSRRLANNYLNLTDNFLKPNMKLISATTYASRCSSALS